MATTRPFAYNPSQTPISGATQIGDLAIGYPSVGFTSSGLQWWNGPDEELGYVICKPIPLDNQPTPIPGDNLFLSTTYKATDISLSNNNQTATQIFSYQQSVLGQTLISGSDKVMFSVKFTSTNPNVGVGGRFIGVGLTAMDYSGNPFGGYPGGDDTLSIGLSDFGQLYFGTGIEITAPQQLSGTSLPTWTNDDVIDVAIDYDLSQLWIRVNGGLWNNYSGSNPASSSVGVDISSFTVTNSSAPGYYPVLCPYIYGKMEILNIPKYGYPSGYNFLGKTTASVGFLRSSDVTDQSFINLVNSKFSQNFTNGLSASSWLNSNGYWTSYTGSLVVTTGLVLNLDANNPSSYSGTGTTWYDISGNSNNVDMQNSGSITWIDGGIGYFTTGSNGWFSKTNGTNIPTGSGLYTFSAWIQLGTSWNAQGIMSVGPFGSGNEANALRTGSTNQFINYWWGNDFVATSSLSPTDNWFNIVARDNGTSRSIFINGISIGTDTPSGHNVTTSDIQVAKTAGSEYLNGNIAQVLIYNTALSNSEILANFNATKSRFGFAGPLSIATNDSGGLIGWGSQALSVAYNPTLISTYPVGSIITFQDGSTATLTMYDPYAPNYIDIFWDTPKSGTLFPITLG